MGLVGTIGSRDVSKLQQRLGKHEALKQNEIVLSTSYKFNIYLPNIHIHLKFSFRVVTVLL
jgi:hypothetical protein